MAAVLKTDGDIDAEVDTRATNPFKTTTSVDMQIDENAPSINIHGGAEVPSAKPRNTVPEATPAGGSANGDTNGEAKDGDDDLNGHGEARDAMRADGGDEEKEEEGSGVEDLGEGHDGEEKLGDDEGEDEYTVEKILDDGEDDDGNKLYLIKWLGYPDSENTWEPMENIPEDLITEYESKKKKTKPKKSGRRSSDKARGNESPAKRATNRRSMARKVKLDDDDDDNGDESDVILGEEIGTPTKSAASIGKNRGMRGRRKSKDNVRATNGTSTSKLTSKESNNFHELPLDQASWENFVDYVDTVQKNNNEVFVVLRWLNGDRTLHKSTQVRIKCPLKLIDFYEHHLTFKTVADTTDADDPSHLAKKRKLDETVEE